MRVLHIITGLTQGGAESALFRLITSKYNNPSVTHIVISMVDFGVYGKRMQDKNIEVYMLNMPRGIPSLKGLRKLWSLIRNIRPDIIQTWMYHSDLIGGVIARLAGYNNVVWGIVNFNLDPSVAGRSTRWTAKLCALLSDIIPRRIISCSQKAITSHQEIGYSKKKFVNIPLGYDLAEFYYDGIAAAALRKAWGITDGTPVIGCVARWDHQKDHQNLLRAFGMISSEFPEVVCVLVGPWMDDQNEDLVALVNKINGAENKIILAGRVDSIPNAMSALDLHILPSLGEAFPNVVAEAMACETPCIVTDVGDAAAIVNNTGWVVPPANSAALADKLRVALRNMYVKEDWQQRSIACRKRIEENYSMQRMIRSYKDLWDIVAEPGTKKLIND